MVYIPYTNVTEPRWGNVEKTIIKCLVTAPSVNDGEPCDMAAAKIDPGWDHSEEIFERAVAGEFGPIAPYVPDAPMSGDVDIERDRRTAETFKFRNRLYQLRPSDIQNITGAALAATLAIMNGAQEGDLRWSNPDKDFEWIATNNNTVTMDAQTVVEFANAAMSFRSGLIFLARSIKDRLLSGEILDITDDALWSDPV